MGATDGLVYLVSSATGCTDWVDIGEQSYSMALLDDLDGNGYMDLMVTTMNGNAFALQTMVRRPASFSLLLSSTESADSCSISDASDCSSSLFNRVRV